MSTLTAYYSTDMLGQIGTDDLYNFGTATVATSSHLQVSYNGEALNLYGNFIFSGGSLTGGTLNRFDYSIFETKQFEITNGSWDLIYFLNSPYGDDYIFNGADTINGSYQDDVLIGYGGNDIINGNLGDDILYGEDGNDILLGGDGHDHIEGGYGNDKLNGGNGNDYMAGGYGNDRYYIDSLYDSVFENYGAGTDLIYSTVSYTLDPNVERLILTGTSSINGTGNLLDNVLIGNDSNNTLIGLAGNDRLDGKGGIDTMLGGHGNDQYFVNHINDVVIENANDGTDTVKSSVSYTLSENVERLYLLGSDRIDATGNNLDNILVGNSHANTLNGMAGDDKMVGKDGNDRYYVDSITDIVVEYQDQGNDAVISSIDYTLGANLERLLLTGQNAINGTGNSYNNTINGNNGDNELRGAGGDDSIRGRNGDDLLIGNAGDDRIFGQYGEDTLSGGSGNDLLFGGANNDILIGGDGNDILVGDIGNDILKGQEGSDIFVLNTLDGIDNILDFTIGEDSFQLDQSVFTGLNATNNQLDDSSFFNAETLSFDEVLSGASILYESSTGSIYYDVDGGTASNASLVATVTDWLTITKTDFDLT